MSDQHDVTYVVGDIHGHADLIRDLQEIIVRDARATRPSAPRVVYIGDYVSRGPDTKQTVDLVCRGLPDFERVFLGGNHELLMQAFLFPEDDFDGVGDAWLRVGGLPTLASYGVSVPTISELLCAREEGTYDRMADRLRRDAALAIPADHRAFFSALEDIRIEDDAIFVHAGLDPELPLDRQDRGDIKWIQDSFLELDRHWGRLVFHGHTPSTRGPEVRTNRVNVDTGSFLNGTLTAAVIDRRNGLRFLATSVPRRTIILVAMPGDEITDVWLDWTAQIVLASCADKVLSNLPHDAMDVIRMQCSGGFAEFSEVTIEELGYQLNSQTPTAQDVESGRTIAMFTSHAAWADLQKLAPRMPFPY